MQVLYIEADEDHVALQKKKKDGDGRRKTGISMSKLVNVYEGIAEKSKLTQLILILALTIVPDYIFFIGKQNFS